VARASGSQLWRLNQLGRLQVVDDAVCLSASEAKRLIEAELEKLGWIASPVRGEAMLIAWTKSPRLELRGPTAPSILV
jgi:hypothetical protein